VQNTVQNTVQLTLRCKIQRSAKWLFRAWRTLTHIMLNLCKCLFCHDIIAYYFFQNNIKIWNTGDIFIRLKPELTCFQVRVQFARRKIFRVNLIFSLRVIS
jgi:hypothetical protein